MANNTISWFEIMGSDGKALQQFYSDVFGWKLEQAPGEMTYGMLSGEGGGRLRHRLRRGRRSAGRPRRDRAEGRRDRRPRDRDPEHGHVRAVP
jgi:hypothetical protein